MHADSRPRPRRRDPVLRAGIGPLRRLERWYHRPSGRGRPRYGHLTTPSSPHPPRPPAAGGLQQQIYASIRRAILDGVVAPGDAAALVARAGRGPRRLAHHDAARGAAAPGRGLSHGAARLRHVRGRGAARRSACSGVARGRRRAPKHPPLSRRGAAVAAAPHGARRLAGPPRAFRIGTPGARPLSGRASGRGWPAAGCAPSPPPSSTTATRPAFARCARPSPTTCRRRAGTRCSADQVLIVAGAQQGFELICRLLLDPGDRAWMEEPGYPGARSALLARRRADRAGAGRRRGPGRRAGRAARAATRGSPT